MTIDGLGDGQCIKAEPLVSSFYAKLAASRSGADTDEHPSDLIKDYEGDEPLCVGRLNRPADLAAWSACSRRFRLRPIVRADRRCQS